MSRRREPPRGAFPAPVATALGNQYVQRVLSVARQGDSEAEAAPEIEQSIRQARGGGQALDSGVRVQMESAFGADFSGVRVHTGPNANSLNQMLSARAFTTGQDVFFKQGEYNPGRSDGQALLAHELTHVVQQTGTEIHARLTVGQPNDEYEQEAEQTAAQVMRMLGSGMRVQRKCACGGTIGANGECSECQKRQAQGRGLQDENERGQARLSPAHHLSSVIQRDLTTPPPAVAPAGQAISLPRINVGADHLVEPLAFLVIVIEQASGTTPGCRWCLSRRGSAASRSDTRLLQIDRQILRPEAARFADGCELRRLKMRVAEGGQVFPSHREIASASIALTRRNADQFHANRAVMIRSALSDDVLAGRTQVDDPLGGRRDVFEGVHVGHHVVTQTLLPVGGEVEVDVV